MRTILLLLAFAASLAAQNSVSITVGTKTWKFVLPVGTLSLTCDQTTLAAGQSSTCTLTLDSPAPAGGYVVTPYSADAPLVLSPLALGVAAGATTATFTVTRPAVAPVPAPPGGIAGAAR